MRMRVLLRWAPWVLLGAFGALVAAAAALAMRGTVVETPLSLIAVMAVMAFVGALLAARRPNNAMGWLCLAGALTSGSQFAARA